MIYEGAISVSVFSLGRFRFLVGVVLLYLSCLWGGKGEGEGTGCRMIFGWADLVGSLS